MVYYGLLTPLPAYDTATSNVPFLALLNGSQGPTGEAFAALARETKGVNAGLRRLSPQASHYNKADPLCETLSVIPR